MKKVESFIVEDGIYHCQYCNHGNHCCATVMPGRLPYICSRERNHEGPHIACGSEKDDHPIASWPNEEETS